MVSQKRTPSPYMRKPFTIHFLFYVVSLRLSPIDQITAFATNPMFGRMMSLGKGGIYLRWIMYFICASHNFVSPVFWNLPNKKAAVLN